MWFIVGLIVTPFLLWVIWALFRTADQEGDTTAHANERVMARVNELQQRDPYSLTEAEFKAVQAADRDDDERHMRTGASIYRSEYLSPEDEARYVTVNNGMPNISLVRKRGQLVMVVPQGMVNFRSRTLHRLDLYAFRARGTGHYEDAVLAASLSPGSKVQLVREPNNEYDANAIAIYSGRGVGPLGYVNRQNAARLAKALDGGESFAAITLSGSPVGRDGDPLTILAAHPEVITHMRA